MNDASADPEPDAPCEPDADSAEPAARDLAALLDVSLEAKLVHRRFTPLYANARFAHLFGFADAHDALGAQNLLALVEPEAQCDPLIAWGAALCAGAVRGERWMRRRDGRAIRTAYAARPLAWRGEAALAMAILPLPAATAATRPVRDVLVVMADEGELRRLRLLLASLDCRAECAASVEEAAQRLAERRFDLIICDLELPDVEGWSAADRLRLAPNGAAPLVVAAPRKAPSHKTAAAAGMDGLIGKPFSPRELERVLALLAPSVEPAEFDQIQ